MRCYRTLGDGNMSPRFARFALIGTAGRDIVSAVVRAFWHVPACLAWPRSLARAGGWFSPSRCLRRRRTLAPSRPPVGLFEYVGMTRFLADLFPVRVDVANRSTLKPIVRPTMKRDAIYAF